MNGIPTGCGDTPVVGGVLVAIDSYLASFYFLIGIDTHDSVIFLLFNFLIYCLQQVFPVVEKIVQNYELILTYTTFSLLWW